MSSQTAKKAPSYKKSDALLARALELIPGGSQTFSKGHTQFPAGAAPLFLTKGKGCRVWDADGNEYIDYALGLGAIILGYGNRAVDVAMKKQIDDGPAFSLPTALEIELSEMLRERIPCAEMARFGKNGSDATSGAIRVARAATGREHVAFCGYHGWQDWHIGATTRSLGVPEAVKALTHPFEYNKLDSLSAIFDRFPGKVAAVILEPTGMEAPAKGFLEGIKKLCKAKGAVLIFDEVVTGFRFARGGAQELYGVTPDLACFGKAMANGMPLSTVVGSRELMKVFDDVFFSFTAGGECVSLAAAKATMLELDRLDAYPHLWKLGERLRDGLNALSKRHGLEKRLRAVGPGPHHIVEFKDERGETDLILKSLFQQEAAARGVLFLLHNICAAHRIQDIDETLAAYDEALAVIAKAAASGEPKRFLKGRAVSPIFRKP